MEPLAKKEHLNRLFDLYAPLLTDRQAEYFRYYHHQDYSLQEISEIFNVSRNAIFDQLKKVESHLLNYEAKLHLLTDNERRQKAIDALEKGAYKEALTILKEGEDL
ncbi:MAG: hypothetical protein WC225_02565 [Acholeplasmataceae bacterium]|nr:DNA-binding protein [Acholeplasmataceae bacterium]